MKDKITGNSCRKKLKSINFPSLVKGKYMDFECEFCSGICLKNLAGFELSCEGNAGCNLGTLILEPISFFHNNGLFLASFVILIHLYSKSYTMPIFWP